jgi:hypothetical protein
MVVVFAGALWMFRRSDRMSSRPAIWYLTGVASIAVGIAPIVVLERWFGVPRKITVGFGVVAWAAAVAIKALIHHLAIDRAVRRGANHRHVSVIQGLLSGVTELGVAAAFFLFVWQPVNLPQLIGFGAGAGMVEAVMLPFISNPFKGSTLEAHSTDVFARSAGSATIQWLKVLERVWATLLHVSSRALVFLTITGGNPLPGAVAICGFAAVDGMAYYGLLEHWRFDEPRTLARFHAFVGVIGAALTGAFVFFGRRYL